MAAQVGTMKWAKKRKPPSRGPGPRVVCADVDAQPFVMPRQQALELVFCRRAFERLRKQVADAAGSGDVEDDDLTIPLPLFQRAFGRLFRLFRMGEEFDARKFDLNGNKLVEWAEFMDVWKVYHPTVRFSRAEWVFITLDDPQSSGFAKILSRLVLLTILVSSLSFVLSTHPDFCTEPGPKTNHPDEYDEPKPKAFFDVVEVVCIVIFTIEFLLRVVTICFTRVELLNKDKLLKQICSDEPLWWSTPLSRILGFVTSPANLIDFIAIMPFYLDLAFKGGPDGLVVLRAVRLTRVFRAVRVAKYADAVIVVVRALKASMQMFFVLGFNLVLGMVIFGSIMYHVEGGKWDGTQRRYERLIAKQWVDGNWVEEWEKTPFDSIPATFWWVLVTCTTVGYGDQYPVSTSGKIVAIATAIWGVMILALPIGVVANNFGIAWSDYIEEKRTNKAKTQAESTLLNATLAICDPITQRCQMKIEVYDDDCSPDSAPDSAPASNHDFMGEAVVCLDMSSGAVATHEMVLKLQRNPAKALRKVTGTLTVEYTWVPRRASEESRAVNSAARGGPETRVGQVLGDVPGCIPPSASDLEDPASQGKELPVAAWDLDRKSQDSIFTEGGRLYLDGQLIVRIIKADNLLNVDWKIGGRVSDPYCVVSVYPSKHGPGGELMPEKWRTSTKANSLSPQWDEERTFDFEGCTGASQVYDPDIHGNLEAAARHYTTFGSLAGYSGSSRELKPGECPQRMEKELHSLREEVQSLRQAIQALTAAVAVQVPAAAAALEGAEGGGSEPPLAGLY